MVVMATEFRNFTNIKGYDYTPEKTDTIYAEDLNRISTAINDVETDVDALPAQISIAIEAAIAATKDALFPIGSIYANGSDNTNPAILLGFGTWTRIAAGRVLLGRAESGGYSTVGLTAGAERVGLHAWIGAFDSNASSIGYCATGNVPNENFLYGGTFNNLNQNIAAGRVNHATRVTDGNGVDASIMQPYLIVNYWKRTA